MAGAQHSSTGQRSPRLLLRLCNLSVLSTLSLFADWSRPLLFNLFVSRNIQASDLAEDSAAFMMDCVSLAIMTLNIVAFASAYGFNGSVDSYAPIAFGAGQPLELHLVLYRQLLLLAALTVVLMAMLLNAAPLLTLAGVPPAVASQTGEVLGLMAWSVPGDLAYDCLGHWARSQQRQSLVTMVAATGLGVNLLLNLLLADPAAPFSAPITALVTQNTLIPLLLAAGLFRARRPLTAPLGAVLRGVPAQLRTGVAAMCWTCAELWAWEVQVFEARALAVGGAASYALLSSTYSFLIMIPCGACFGLTSLVGEAIGAGLPGRARELLGMGCVYGMATVTLYALPLSLERRGYARLLSGGVPAVQSQLEAVLPAVLAMQLCDGLFNILKSWLVVRQHQVFGAVQSLLVYYAVGLPLGWWLAFPQGWGLLGLWLGLGVAVVTGTAACAALVVKDMRELCGDYAPPACDDVEPACIGRAGAGGEKQRPPCSAGD
mmetsp:Transcript_39149/g.113027  ORF Transcript_39149/g.113027 Transcript_39149/m.113027 type:complete len:489 (-) Transcript_39149:38-1504(-)